jgi:hypothetical protein
MATAPDQGIMSLPQAEQAPPPQLSLNESYGAVQQGLQNASPDASKAVNDTLDKLAPMMDQLDDKTLNMLLQLIQYLMDHEKEYPQLIAQLAQKGAFPEGTFPEQYDSQFLSTFGMMIMHAQQARSAAPAPSPEMTPPATMARGGIAEAARTVARQGRGQDSMLAHITPREAGLLRAHGGMGTMNPNTGLQEFGLFDFVGDFFKGVGDAISGIVKGVVNVVKDVVSSPIGKILGTIALATFLGPGAFGITGLGLGAAALPLASAGVTLLGGGSIQDALISGATAYFGAPGGVVSEFVGGFGGVMTNTAVNAAVSAGLVGTGAGLLQGKSLADSVKNGLVAGAIGGGMAALPSFSGEGVSLKEPVAGQAPGQTSLTEGASNPLIAKTGTEDFATDLSNKGEVPTDFKMPTRPGQEISGPYQTPRDFQMPTRPGQEMMSMSNSGAENVQGVTAPETLNSPTQSSNFKMPTRPGQQTSGPAEVGTSLMDKASGMLNKVTDKVTDFYDKNLFPSDIKQAGTEAAEKAGNDALSRLPANATDALKTAAYQKAYDAAMPGMLQTYGPLAGAGLAGLALTGGFDVKPVQLTPEQQAMQDDVARERADLAANPGKWYSKNLRGVTYDKNGVPIASKPYDPAAELPSSLVPSTGRPSYLPAMQQPYNTSAVSSDLNQYMYKPPAKKAMGGGIGSLGNGGYPRKTGAINGPGTATSDSIPAMLSDGEFVMTAKAVRGAGKGSRLAGAKKMYALMHQLERNASRS